MANLSPLHRGIKRVRRFRSVARLGSGVAQWVTAAGWLFLITFGLDWIGKMDTVERAVLLGLEALVPSDRHGGGQRSKLHSAYRHRFAGG